MYPPTAAQAQITEWIPAAWHHAAVNVIEGERKADQKRAEKGKRGEGKMEELQCLLWRVYTQLTVHKVCTESPLTIISEGAKCFQVARVDYVTFVKPFPTWMDSDMHSGALQQHGVRRRIYFVLMLYWYPKYGHRFSSTLAWLVLYFKLKNSKQFGT